MEKQKPFGFDGFWANVALALMTWFFGVVVILFVLS